MRILRRIGQADVAKNFAGNPSVRAARPVNLGEVTYFPETLGEGLLHRAHAGAVGDNNGAINIPEDEFFHGAKRR